MLASIYLASIYKDPRPAACVGPYKDLRSPACKFSPLELHLHTEKA